MNLIEFESQLAKIGKCFYVFSHSAALQRYTEFDPDAEFVIAFDQWVDRSPDTRFHCVEICDACDVLKCTNKKHLHEWGVFGFGHTLHEAFVSIIGELNRRHKINFTHLATEIPDLRSKVRFWNNAWHEQRILTGKNFWMQPYKMDKINR